MNKPYIHAHHGTFTLYLLHVELLVYMYVDGIFQVKALDFGQPWNIKAWKNIKIFPLPCADCKMVKVTEMIF